jgi:N-acetylmuramoyl-L-alanine amidase
VKRTIRVLAGLCALALSAAACSGGADVSTPVPTLFDNGVPVDGVDSVDSVDSVDPSTASTTSVPVAERLPALSVDIPGAVRAGDGTARPITGTDGEVWFIWGACTTEASQPAITADLIGPQHVVLDPGGGGVDRGFQVGGLVEAELNLDIARRTAALLRADGIAVTLTRDTDADLSAAARGALGPAVAASAFVSIEHPAPGSATVGDARPEIFHQLGDEESRRLAGLLHEELVDVFAGFDQEWAAFTEPGVKPLLNQRGDNFFVVLDRSTGTPGVLVRPVALGEDETALLSTEEGRAAEAEALAKALVRFLVTDEQGTGFVEPAETLRTAPTSNTPGGCGS